jgi:pimeloyl-ACP methyl ester carboxylesterase
MTTRPGRRTVAAATLSASLLVLTACGSQSPEIPRARQVSADVPFTGCDKVKCSDTLNGAAYEIKMPTTWNGTLLLYSHGYRYAQPAPPDFSPVETKAVSASDDETAKQLLSAGYALAGSAYKSNGWAVQDGVAAAEDLHKFFVDNVGQPYRTEIWGDSLGGLITQMIAEKHPEWVDGAAPLCGVMAGVVPNMNLALDVSYAVKTLIYPQMKLTGYSSYQEAVDNWTNAMKALIAAASDVKGGGTAKILYIAALVDAPSQTLHYDGSSVESKVKATVEALATDLGYATFARYDLEQRFGGNPSGNTATDYPARINDTEASLINAVTAGAVEKFNAELVAGEKITADDSAKAKALAEGGDPKATITKPEITMHTAADPLVISQNQSFFLNRYQAAQKAGTATAGLVQTFTLAPATYPESPGAPYGAGHCNFTPTSNVAILNLLTDWVQNGVFPGTAGIQTAMGTSSGYNAAWSPGPWPEPSAK